MDITLLLLALAVGGLLGIGGTCWIFLKFLRLLIALRGQGHPPINSGPRIEQKNKIHRLAGSKNEARVAELIYLMDRQQDQQQERSKKTSTSFRKRRGTK